jgi:hypothetical protein
MGAVFAGVVLLVATALLMRAVVPRAGRPSRSWMERGAVSSTLALLIVIGFITGIAFIVSGFAYFT